MSNEIYRYNKTRYNLRGASVLLVTTSRRLSARFECAAGEQLPLPVQRSNRVLFRSEAHAYNGLPRERTLRSNVLQLSEMFVFKVHQRSLELDVNQDIHVSKRTHHPRTHNTTILTHLHVGKVLHTNRENKHSFESYLHVGKIFPLTRNKLMFFDSYILMGLIRFAYATIDVEIPPGGELRIDSEAFTAMMNQVSVLPRYEGDWIFFDRESQQLIVHTGTGPTPTGEVLYNWRFI